MIPYSDVSIAAPRDSDSYALALMVWGNPGSWLPTGLNQVLASAAPGFALVSAESGRLDYIETLDRWLTAFKRFDLPKYLAYGAVVLPHRFDGTLRRCAERHLLEHYRIVLERVA